MTKELLNKYEKLKEYLISCESVAIAFSSGVDSTFLLYAAKDALKDKAIAVTAASSSFPKRELNEAEEYCAKLGIRHCVVKTEELKIEGFVHNAKNRCYLCKREIFEKIQKTADEYGMNEVIEGSNLDDDGDYRPGLQAIKELGVKSPLRELLFTKSEIRELSKYFDIPTWNKPSYACLASRIPYGDIIDEEKLSKVDKAEQYLIDLGFNQLRVRIHGDVARIELEPSEFDKILAEDIRKKIFYKFKEIGFSYVAIDILGYRTGSMNETIL